MLDELLGAWLDKKKAKKELYKAYKMYQEKKKPYLKVSTIKTYEEIQDIQYAIAYVLCKYFNVTNSEFNTSSIKWDICYDYTHHYDACKEAYERLTKVNETDYSLKDDILNDDDIMAEISDVAKRMMDNHDAIYDIENGDIYYKYWQDKSNSVWKKY